MSTAAPTQQRSDTGPRLIGRDFDALIWIALQYAICLDHLCILFARLVAPREYKQSSKETEWLTEKRAMNVVRDWERLGLVQKV